MPCAACAPATSTVFRPHTCTDMVHSIISSCSLKSSPHSFSPPCLLSCTQVPEDILPPWEVEEEQHMVLSDWWNDEANLLATKLNRWAAWSAGYAVCAVWCIIVCIG